MEIEIKENNVEHPVHYNRDDAIECLDEMVALFGEEAVAYFCICNVWKYRYRACDKNGLEDLKKSDFYMKQFLILKEKLKNEYNINLFERTQE